MTQTEILREAKVKLEKANTRKQKANQEVESLEETIKELDSACDPARELFIKEGVDNILRQCGWTKGELIKALGGTISEAAKIVKEKGKRVSSPSPTLVNPSDPSQTCKIKGKQPEWRKALMREAIDYRLWNHVKDSLQHLDEENRKINNDWLNKNATQLGEG